MKRILILIVILIYFIVQVQAKVEKIKTIPATVILKNGDSLNVNILLQGKLILPYKLVRDSHFDRALLSFQNGIYYNGNQNEIKKILPKDAQKIIFNWGKYLIIMISSHMIKGIENNEGIFEKSEDGAFLELEIDGKISSYVYRHVTTNPPAIVTSNVLIKDNGEIVFLKNIMLGKSEKKLYSLFSDCPSLVKLIDNDIATKGKLDIIIEYYNLYCK